MRRWLLAFLIVLPCGAASADRDDLLAPWGDDPTWDRQDPDLLAPEHGNPRQVASIDPEDRDYLLPPIGSSPDSKLIDEDDPRFAPEDLDYLLPPGEPGSALDDPGFPEDTDDLLPPGKRVSRAPPGWDRDGLLEPY